MRYSFSNEYLNMFVSTDGGFYVKFKEKCEEDFGIRGGKEILYGGENIRRIIPIFHDYWIKYNDGSFKYIDLDRMKTIIGELDKRDLLLTGAGISKESGIPLQEELEKKLKLYDPPAVWRKCHEEPSFFSKQLRFFYLRLVSAKPTSTHQWIYELQRNTGISVATENLDMLHEAVGTKVIHVLREMERLKKMKFRRVILLGIGNPCCQSVLKLWENKGSSFWVVAPDKPNLNIDYFEWYEGKANDLTRGIANA